MCAMFIILVAFASVKMAFDSVPLALFSRASGLIGTEYTTVNHASKSPLARSFKASVTQEKGQRHGAKGHIKTLTQ